MIKILYIPNIQYLTYDTQTNTLLENNPMNRFDTRFYKGSVNTLDLVVRDKDRRPISLIDKTLVITILKVNDNRLTLKRTLEKVDEQKGLARLTLSENDLANWDIGFYTYAVSVAEGNGREGFALVDQTYKVTGQFEVMIGAVPTYEEDQVCTEFYTVDNDWSDVAFDPWLISSAFVFKNGKLHTGAFYLTDFIGDIKIQVTMDLTVPTNPSHWNDYLEETFLDETTGIQYYNIQGNYTFVRFMYKLDAMSDGTVDKVVFR